MMTKEDIEKYGINKDNLTLWNGDMNIIVQSPVYSEDELKETGLIVMPDIYQPRKNRVWSYAQNGETIDLSDETQRKEYVEHLKDSAERLKILSYCLSKQAEEIEKLGYPKTNCYFPNLNVG